MIDPKHFALLPLLAMLLSCLARGEEIDFAREIQPIFAARCLECHGPDMQEANFRLDDPQSASRPADSGDTPIVPGNPRASAILARLTTPDPDLRMPPEGERVSGEEAARIAAWIRQGALYTRPWAPPPLQRATIEAALPSDWISSPIDLYILSQLHAVGLQPSAEADRTTLIRRLHYDLIGLPPSIEAVDAFLADQAPDAYERLVEQLLASPRFGERWGRHWLDKARYADSDGYEKDNARPHAWHYRDWVIRAVNEDLSFDQFTVEQLAGDLLPGAHDQQHLATAFNRQTLTNTEGGTDREQWRVAAVMDRAETLGTVWLGLTVGCARCHNHKYDQITQDEYYQLFAFFNNGEEATREIAFLDANKPIPVRVIAERRQQPRKTHVMRRGDFLQPEHEVQPATLRSLPTQPSDQPAPNRLDLARWLVGGLNPLTPRVVVNQIWQSLFGEGLVRTANDFGIRGEPPTHPRLLDWLAREFVHNGWSRKHMIRTIVLSSTYRQASVYRPPAARTDPANRLLHRQNRFRVEAEIIRDVTLAASGLLSGRIGGPSVFPPIPPSVTELTYNSGFRWKTSEGEDRFRRGMYTFFKRTAPHPNLTTFDCPSSTITMVKRERSNTPIAALVTLNNIVYVEAARALALQLVTEWDDDDARLQQLWRRCVARPPSQQERTHLQQLLREARHYYQGHPQQAAVLAAQQQPARDVAAWTATCRIVLNLDEFITRE